LDDGTIIKRDNITDDIDQLIKEKLGQIKKEGKK
jgi:hypothetical protein